MAYPRHAPLRCEKVCATTSHSRCSTYTAVLRPLRLRCSAYAAPPTLLRLAACFHVSDFRLCRSAESPQRTNPLSKGEECANKYATRVTYLQGEVQRVNVTSL